MTREENNGNEIIFGVREFDALKKRIGLKIKALRLAAGMKDPADLAKRLGATVDHIKKTEAGLATTMFAKLFNVAVALGTTPNEILDFPDGRSRDYELFLAVMDGAFQALGCPPEQAATLAQQALEAANSPVVRDAINDQAAVARSIARHLAWRAIR